MQYVLCDDEKNERIRAAPVLGSFADWSATGVAQKQTLVNNGWSIDKIGKGFFVFLAFCGLGSSTTVQFGHQQVRILMLGLDGAGKTTILYKLKLVSCMVLD